MFFAGVTENLTTFLYTLNRGDKKTKGKKFSFLKCITVSKWYQQNFFSFSFWFQLIQLQRIDHRFTIFETLSEFLIIVKSRIVPYKFAYLSTVKNICSHPKNVCSHPKNIEQRQKHSIQNVHFLLWNEDFVSDLALKTLVQMIISIDMSFYHALKGSALLE